MEIQRENTSIAEIGLGGPASKPAETAVFLPRGKARPTDPGLMVKIKHGKLGAVPKLQLIQNGA